MEADRLIIGFKFLIHTELLCVIIKTLNTLILSQLDALFYSLDRWNAVNSLIGVSILELICYGKWQCRIPIVSLRADKGLSIIIK